MTRMQKAVSWIKERVEVEDGRMLSDNYAVRRNGQNI